MSKKLFSKDILDRNKNSNWLTNSMSKKLFSKDHIQSITLFNALNISLEDNFLHILFINQFQIFLQS